MNIKQRKIQIEPKTKSNYNIYNKNKILLNMAAFSFRGQLGTELNDLNIRGEISYLKASMCCLLFA